MDENYPYNGGDGRPPEHHHGHSKRKRFSGLTAYPKSAVRWIKTYLYPYLKPLLKRVLRWLRKLPWRLIGLIAAAVLIVLFLSLRLFFARPDRILNNFSENAAELKELDSQIRDIDAIMSKATAKNLVEIRDELDAYGDLADDVDNSLPLKFFSTYALSNKTPDMNERLDTLYDPKNVVPVDETLESSKALATVTHLTHQLMNEQDPKKISELVKFLEDAKRTIEDLDKSDAIDLKVIHTLYSYILEAATLYQQSGDKFGFETRYSNLSSELTKEIANAWYASLGGVQRQQISAQLNTLEAITASVDED